MSAAYSLDIYVVAECLQHNFNPYLKNNLEMTARDLSILFATEYGENLKKVVDAALEQWNS